MVIVRSMRMTPIFGVLKVFGSSYSIGQSMQQKVLLESKENPQNYQRTAAVLKDLSRCIFSNFFLLL